MKVSKRALDLVLEGVLVAFPILGIKQLVDWAFALFGEPRWSLGEQVETTLYVAMAFVPLYIFGWRQSERQRREEDFQHRVALRILHDRLGGKQFEDLLTGEVVKEGRSYRLNSFAMNSILYDARL